MAGALLPHAREGYIALRTLPDGRVAGVRRLLFHYTMHVGIDEWGYEERYCYACILDALSDLGAWDGRGDPPGRWHKHPDTGRRRDPDTGEVWHERDDGARAMRVAEVVR